MINPVKRIARLLRSCPTVAITPSILAVVLSLPRQSDAADYLTSEQVVPASASQLPMPLSGLSEDVAVVPPGDFGKKIGSHVPILTEMFEGAVLELAPRFYYFYASNGDIRREEAAYGGSATLTTGWWRDFLRIGLSGYTSQPLYTPDERGNTGLLQQGGDGYWATGEAYIEGKFGELFTVKGPRQELNLPYFNRNDSRMTPVVHEAYSVISDAVPNLSIGAAHITQIKNHTSTDFVPLSEAAGANGTDRGATLAGLRYHWREKQSNIGMLIALGWDTFNTIYAESAHVWELPNDFELNTATQFTHQSSVGEEFVGDFESHSIGLQAALSYQGLIGTVAYTATDEGARIRNPWGGSPSFNSVMISNFSRPGEDAWRIGLSYPLEYIGLKGVSASANYVWGDTPESGSAASPDQEEFNVNLDLRPENGVFKDFWLRLRYAQNDGLLGIENKNLRVILNYSMSF